MPEAPYEGWEPTIGDDLSVAELVEIAFDYRGDVTLERVDGSEVLGYLFNRDARGPSPFVELFEAESGARVRVPYGDIAGIRFTGRDMASGWMYEAFKRKKEERLRSGGSEQSTE